MKNICFLIKNRLQKYSTLVRKPYRDLLIKESFRLSELDVENTCLNGLFWTGLRAKHDIIQGARDRLCKEQAHAI